MKINTEQTYRELPISSIVRDPNQPRINKLTEDDIADLAVSIGEIGVIEPIVVTPANDIGVHTIIVGERRWRACQKNNLTTIPALVRDLSDESIIEVQLAENLSLFRMDLDMEERARAIKKLCDIHGQETVAKRLNKTQGWVSQAIAILDIPDNVRELSSQGVTKDKTTLVMLSKLAKEDKSAADAIVDSAKGGKKIDRKEISKQLRAAKGLPEKGKKKDSKLEIPLQDNESDWEEEVPENTHHDDQENALAQLDEIVSQQNNLAQQPKPKRPVNRDKVKKVTQILGITEDMDESDLLERLIDEFLKNQT